MAIPAADTVEYRVRFDEGGADGALRTSAYLRYMQDAASVHSSKLGYTRERYRQEGLFWVVRHLDLTVHAPSYPGDVIAVSTEVQGFRRIWARRRSEFHSGAGDLLAEADIDWVLTSADGRPTRVPDEIIRAFPGLDAQYRPARLELPPSPADAIEHERRAEPYEVDPMGHVNNAAYLDQFEALFDELGSASLRSAVPRRYRVEYLSSAPAGSGLRWIAWPTATGVAGSLSREPGGDAVARVLAEETPAPAEGTPAVAEGSLAAAAASEVAQARAATSG